jgi:protein gp37
MSTTEIPYLTKNWRPVDGCTPVSDGCDNCYALRNAKRWKRSFQVTTRPERLEEPLHWRKPQRVGVCFHGDLFHEKVPDEFLDKVFAVMALTPQHTYVLLTKRPERMRAYLTQDWDEDKQIVGCRDRIYMAAEEMGGFDYIPDGFRWPLPNVWLGVSVEDQQTADERIPLLLETPAAHRWLSCEPLLEAVDLTDLSAPAGEQWDCLDRCEAADAALEGACAATLDWVVVGGESGPKAREMDLVSLVLVMKQCEEAGVPAYCKQDSGPRPGQQGRIPDPLWAVKQLPDGWA